TCGNGARVRKISSGGMTTLIAGNGTSASTVDDGGLQLANQVAIQNPIGIAVDRDENVYIGEFDSHRIKKVWFDGGALTPFAGTGVSGSSGEDAAATAGQLGNPRGLALDDGGVVVSSWNNFKLRRIDL